MPSLHGWSLYITCLLVGTKMNDETNLKQQKQNQNQTQTQSKENKKTIETPSINSVMRKRDQKRYYRAVKQLGIIKQKEKDGIRPKSIKDLNQRLRMTKKYHYIIARYLRTRARKARQLDMLNQHSKKGQPITVRPFNEVITDPLCVALCSKRNGSCLPIRKEWPLIKSRLNGLVSSYIMENKDSGPLPSYDSQEVHRGFRVIKCVDEFSKEFLFKCLNSIQENWKDLNLALIPAAEIPEEKLPPIDLQQEFAPMNDTPPVAANVKVNPAAGKKPEKSSSLARKELGQTKGNQGNKQFKTHLPKNSKNTLNFRGNEKKTTRMHDLSTNKPENFPGNLLIKQYMTQHPQTSRDNDADFSMKNRSYPHNYDQRNEELPSTSWQNNNYFNSRAETQFNVTLPASNETSWRSRERDLQQTQMQTNWRGPSDFNPNHPPGSNITQFYQDSSNRCNNSYTNQNRNESFATSNETSRRSMERNPALINSGDWRRFNDLYANSGSQHYQDFPPAYSDHYRNRDERLPASYEPSRRRSSERNPFPTHQTLMNSEDWRRPTDLYANSSQNKTESFQDFPPRCRSPFRNRDDRLPASYETSRRNNERNWSPNWRRSPEFNANSGQNVTQYYQDSPSHYSNSSRTAKYNMSGEEGSYRNYQFNEVTPQQNFENFPNYSSQPDPRSHNNNLFSRNEENFFPRDDNEIPPPPPRWCDDERNNRIEGSRRSSHRSRRSSRSRRSRRN